ncbi:MAG TPA: hypothetical protein EYP33_00575 [Pyrodictium sp.]|nr:hypothetical protein [Pyrodictium sp.]
MASWIITKDNIDDGEALKHWNGKEATREEAEINCVYKFRMLDDDNNIYYYGRSSDKDSEDAFSPLDDFGRPNAGCTEIQYYENGKWETL